MLRRAFLKRAAFAALATWFLDVPLPRENARIASDAEYLAQLDKVTPGLSDDARLGILRMAHDLADFRGVSLAEARALAGVQ